MRRWSEIWTGYDTITCSHAASFNWHSIRLPALQATAKSNPNYISPFTCDFLMLSIPSTCFDHSPPHDLFPLRVRLPKIQHPSMCLSSPRVTTSNEHLPKWIHCPPNQASPRESHSQVSPPKKSKRAQSRPSPFDRTVFPPPRCKCALPLNVKSLFDRLSKGRSANGSV